MRALVPSIHKDLASLAHTSTLVCMKLKRLEEAAANHVNMETQTGEKLVGVGEAGGGEKEGKKSQILLRSTFGKLY